jgi:hypothetical protein
VQPACVFAAFAPGRSAIAPPGIDPSLSCALSVHVRALCVFKAALCASSAISRALIILLAIVHVLLAKQTHWRAAGFKPACVLNQVIAQLWDLVPDDGGSRDEEASTFTYTNII